ncbi:MAG: nitroreductase family protein [Bacillota bacterium]
MDFTAVISSRRAVRKYKSDPVPESKMQKLYEALNLAPSGNNAQPYEFIFVRDGAVRKQIVSEGCHQEFIGEAPVLMVAVCDPGKSFDAAIAVDHLILAATNEGLGTCWIGWIEREPIKNILGIPAEKEVPVLVPIGFPAENPPAKPRKPLGQIIRFDKYQ